MKKQQGGVITITELSLPPWSWSFYYISTSWSGLLPLYHDNLYIFLN